MSVQEAGEVKKLLISPDYWMPANIPRGWAITSVVNRTRFQDGWRERVLFIGTTERWRSV